VRLRRVGACAVAVLALAGLSACRTKAGAAAFVDGHRINEGDVSKYVVPGYATPSGGTRQQAPPRVLALDSIIQTQLMARVLAKTLGGVPSESDLAAQHDQALATVIGIQQTGANADAALRQLLAERGVKASFAPVVVRQAELTMVVIKKINAQQQGDIANAVKKAAIPVTVNARYGSWSADNASISGTVTPDFLTLGSSAPPPTQS
jgi:hypothetical protein